MNDILNRAIFVIVSDLQGHSPIVSLVKYVFSYRCTVNKISTDVARHAIHL